MENQGMMFQRASRRWWRSNWPAAALIVLYLVIALAADIRPYRNVYFFYKWFDRHNADMLALEVKLSLSQRYSPGHAYHSFSSLPYLLAVKLTHAVVPFRLLCLRLISVASSALALYLLHRIAARLFGRRVGMLFLFLLVTSPVYLEVFRAFGFIPLTNAAVVLACFLLVINLRESGFIIRPLLLALVGYGTLSLYAPGRLVVFFPVLFYSFYLRSSWKKLLTYIFSLSAVILLLDTGLGDTRFKLKEFILVGPEWLEKRPDLPGESLPSRLKEYGARNLRRMAAYFSPLPGKPFFPDDIWEISDRLFPPVYLPFFFIGLAVGFGRRRPPHVFLLLWLFLFAGIPLASSSIPLRRLVFSLNPLYLLIACGLWFAFVRIRRRISSPRLRRFFARLCLFFLLAAGGYGLFVFAFRIARPKYGYSRQALRSFALSLSAAGRSARAIRVNDRAADLIWGNPYFDRRWVGGAIIGKLESDGREFLPGDPRPRGIKGQIAAARKAGGGILYVHALPEGARGDRWWREADIEEVTRAKGDGIVLSRPPGIDGVYFLYVECIDCVDAVVERAAPRGTGQARPRPGH